MKIQSAGRLGNILFIWAYASYLQENSISKNLVIFADKYHTTINKELEQIQRLLGDDAVKFEINNRLGFFLKCLDKLTAVMPKLGLYAQKKLRIYSEQTDLEVQNAWILRGYFQDLKVISNIDSKIWQKLERIVQNQALEGRLTERLPFLTEPYQAIHVRLTDYVGSEFGVIDLNSQIGCLQSGLKLVICTDGTREDIEKRFSTTNYEVITPENSSAWETLAILSGAENLITSNSTLSWWAGFLACHTGKSVWTPKYWNPAGTTSKGLQAGSVKTYIPIFE